MDRIHHLVDALHASVRALRDAIAVRQGVAMRIGSEGNRRRLSSPIPEADLLHDLSDLIGQIYDCAVDPSG